MKRLKRRYLSLQIDSERAPSEREFLDAVWAAVVRMYGEYGASKAYLALIRYDCEVKHAVLRANLDFVDNVRTALATMTSINGCPAAVHVVAVSGTIKALLEK